MDAEFKKNLIHDLEEISRNKLSSLVRACAMQAIQVMTDDGERIEALERALSNDELEKKQKWTHGWCDNCCSNQEIYIERPAMISTDGRLLGGDICCKECRLILATLGILSPEVTVSETGTNDQRSAAV